MKTLIENGRVVTAVDDYRADILIEDGTVSLIGKEINVEADKVIDAAGRLVIPGRDRSPYAYGAAVWREIVSGRRKKMIHHRGTAEQGISEEATRHHGVD
ncbi:hypothetical protein BH24ACI3_BH24ACI3_13800 [soil metagenome]